MDDRISVDNDNEMSSLLEEALYAIKRCYICEETVYPLILSNPTKTRLDLDKAGALYQCALTAIHFSQYRRASWYVLALYKFAEDHFSSGAVNEAKLSAIRSFIEDSLNNRAVKKSTF